jgi:predicted oxidoreductase
MTGADDRTHGAWIGAAVDAGITLVDTADVYGLDWGGTGFGACEATLGRVLAASPALRDRIVLATKGGIVPGVPYDSSAPAITRACEASLRRLGVDHVDLYQIHRPDLFAHPEEVAGALAALVDRGLARTVGVSNHTVAQTRALAAHLPFPLATTQPEYSLAHLDPLRDGTLDLCAETGMVPLAWSPLGGGRLVSGEGVRPGLLTAVDAVAAEHGLDRAGVAVAFVCAHPTRPVALVGTGDPDRLRALVAAAAVPLDRATVYRLVEAAEGVPLP